MRDTINPNKITKYIQEIDSVLNDLYHDVTESANSGIQLLLLDLLLEKAIGFYSLGKTRQEMLEVVIKLIDMFEAYFQFDKSYGDYDIMIWTLSLCLLCDVSDEEFKRVTSVLERDKVQDALIEMIIKHKLGSWPYSTGSVIQKHPYERAQHLNSAADIKEYLNKIWYKGHDEAAWHDIHKNTKVNRFFGYWAWETAATVKIKGIDDSSLKDQLYYPYDAVHW